MESVRDALTAVSHSSSSEAGPAGISSAELALDEAPAESCGRLMWLSAAAAAAAAGHRDDAGRDAAEITLALDASIEALASLTDALAVIDAASTEDDEACLSALD